MRRANLRSVRTALLVVSALLAAPANQAQRIHGSARRGPSTFSNNLQRTGRRGSGSFFGSPVAGTNLFPGGAAGVNGTNAIMNPGNLGVEAAIDPATQWNLALAARIQRNNTGVFPGGGFYLLGGGGAYTLPEDSSDYAQPEVTSHQQQPQVIVLQQAPMAQAPASAFQGSDQPSAPPLPDAGQFTLILHNGKQIEAVAFTHMKNNIVYITVDGSRRTIALSEIDTDATIRINQERGTPLQLPL